MSESGLGFERGVGRRGSHRAPSVKESFKTEGFENAAENTASSEIPSPATVRYYVLHTPMTQWYSKAGIFTAGMYVLVCVFLIISQGLFGESFIAIILGVPWSFALAAVEFGGAKGPILYVLVLAPLVLNMLVLYWVAATIEGSIQKRSM